VVWQVHNRKDVGVAEGEVERFELAAKALDQRSGGGHPFRSAVFQQTLGPLSGVGRMEQVFRHTASCEALTIPHPGLRGQEFSERSSSASSPTGAPDAA